MPEYVNQSLRPKFEPARQKDTAGSIGSAPVQVLDDGKIMAAALAAQQPDSAARIALACSFCRSLMQEYWARLNRLYEEPWPLPEPETPGELISLPAAAQALAARLGEAAAALPTAVASYRIGVIYTAMLPSDVRRQLGVYYTPPPLVDRLLDLATEAGVDWTRCRALDPACGGGAFLAPIAERMLVRLDRCEPALAVQNISHRLQGFEIDPFAAWMSQVFLEATLLRLCRRAGLRLPAVVTVCNTLELSPTDASEGFDLIAGNPPYGRITLSPPLRHRFERSLYGHANLYAVFTDIALRFARPGGVIALLTPTSFLAGEYFKNLRRTLGEEAAPASLDFIEKRNGVFDDVLQEAALSVYRRGGEPEPAPVHFLTLTDTESLAMTPAGAFVLPEDPSQPWLIFRVPEQRMLIARMQSMTHRLSDYGYRVSTGPLVWNRHKPQLRDTPGDNCYPLIWAESVTNAGRFSFRATQRDHKPYVRVPQCSGHLLTRRACVLVQRTTSKEQQRRLNAAVLAQDFIDAHGAVVIENHLNQVRSLLDPPRLSLDTLAVFLNTRTADHVFRCISGSVAVSAYELEALPLPPPAQMAQLEELVAAGVPADDIESAVRAMYLGEVAVR